VLDDVSSNIRRVTPRAAVSLRPSQPLDGPDKLTDHERHLLIDARAREAGRLTRRPAGAIHLTQQGEVRGVQPRQHFREEAGHLKYIGQSENHDQVLQPNAHDAAAGQGLTLVQLKPCL